MTQVGPPTIHEERTLALAQRQALLEALQAGQVVNRKWAHDELDIFELSARIVELEQAGVRFKKGWTQIPTRYGSRKVRTYELETEEPARPGLIAGNSVASGTSSFTPANAGQDVAKRAGRRPSPPIPMDGLFPLGPARRPR